MPNEEGRRTDDVRMLIKTFAFYVHRGLTLEWHEPPVRRRKGTAHDSQRSISFTIQPFPSSGVRSRVSRLVRFRVAARFEQRHFAVPTHVAPFRKPFAGMLTAFADKHFIDLGRSLYGGDTEDDRACAAAADVGHFEWAHDFFGSPAPENAAFRSTDALRRATPAP